MRLRLPAEVPAFTTQSLFQGLKVGNCWCRIWRKMFLMAASGENSVTVLRKVACVKC